jgi:GAF domain-containing protein
VDRDRESDLPPSRPASTGLAHAYSQLSDLLLDEPDLGEFMLRLAALSAALVPRSSCGILLRLNGAVSALSNDGFAQQLDEIQYGQGQGPCLQALTTGEQVRVLDLEAESRWSSYRDIALLAGLRSSISLPLIVGDTTIAALNIYSRDSNGVDDVSAGVVELFARQAATTLALLLRASRQSARALQMQQALQVWPLIDQAIGIVMVQQHLTANQALAALREVSQRTNRRLSGVAADLIEAVTGQAPDPPRSFTERE